ncbi:GDYXXLXY domain-containing protein [Neptuniibacter sp.]|uniref:GDYXXLXY domain-containing protein n=1 Tax=Neptuniibacter sp. TaxID=1962643 RepID=UPI00261DA7F7|nr:GDYXXLXY domain-containing protein [Neptuniibacter sp.]MCP4597889.1 DUF4401 domain-containing protein [Neptuniibacter sp.]
MNNADQLWQKLEQNKLVSGPAPETQQQHSPWFIKVMQGFAGWFAALFMLGFVASMFSWLFRYDNEVLLLIAGLFCTVAAYLIYRAKPVSAFYDQLALAISLCGQFMVTWGLFELFNDREISVYLTLSAFQATLAVVMPSFLHRVLSSWFAMVALFWGFNRLGIFGLDSAIAAFLFTLIWIKDRSWYRYTNILIPIGYGFAISLIQFSGHALFQNEILGFSSTYRGGFLQQKGPIIGAILLSLSCLYLVKVIFEEQQLELRSVVGIASLAALLLLLAVSSFIPGLSSALLILLVGFHRERSSLIGLGLIALISFISWYYYNLQETLLTKSYYLATMGTVCLFCYWIAQRLTPSQKKQSIFNSSPLQRRQWLSLLTVIIILGSVNLNISQKENHLAQGETVLLELAPVDPRSLMQGDYMRLRFKITNQAFNRSLHDELTDGYLLATLDKNSIAQFVALSPSAEGENNQIALRYRIRNGQVKFATNAFFFEEGKADLFQQAKYGVFKVAKNGELLLHSLQDSKFMTLGVNSP